MNVKVKIRRFNPEKDRRPHWSEFNVDAEPMDRVLDVLQMIKEQPGRHADVPALVRARGLRVGCDGDQRPESPCVQDAGQRLGSSIVVEPLRGLPVIKDLTVDMEPFWRQYRRSSRF